MNYYSVFSSLLTLVMYPFSSDTIFVVIPFAFLLVICIFGIVGRLMRGKF